MVQGIIWDAEDQPQVNYVQGKGPTLLLSLPALEAALGTKVGCTMRREGTLGKA